MESWRYISPREIELAFLTIGPSTRQQSGSCPGPVQATYV